MYFFSAGLAGHWQLPASSPHHDAHYIFLILLTVLAAGISSVNYRHRHDEFQATQDAIRVAEALSGAQLRAQLAENAISIGKLSAALSHEINSPLGALLSSIDTLIAVTDRQLTLPPEARDRLADTRAGLVGSIRDSAARVEEVTRRLRRFVTLEEAELKSADLNELLSDVAVLHDEEIRERHIEVTFDLEKQLPKLTCRPQLLSAAFSTFLSNSIQAVNGDGRIEIQTRGRGPEVEVTIRDNGRGMSPEQADTIFDPTFRVSGSRVSSGNWGLFNSRQIVYEHGGEIRVDTAEGRGTTVLIILPVTASEV
jgi:two-component system NtrC family sensor kinase